jgi:hypothetical protein
MELDELKASWEQVNERIEKHLKLNTKLIEKMTSQNYRTIVSRIVYPELLGGLVCLAAAIAIIWNFARFDTLGLQMFSCLSVLLLFSLTLVSFLSLRGLNKADLGLSSYADTLKRFTVRKIRFQRLQRQNMVLTSLFMIVFIPTAVRLLAQKDITRSSSFWFIILPICLVLQFLVSKWVYRHYARTLKEAEALLADLES